MVICGGLDLSSGGELKLYLGCTGTTGPQIVKKDLPHIPTISYKCISKAVHEGLNRRDRTPSNLG